VVVDTAEAQHEAGDLLQAGLYPGAFPTLREILLRESASRHGPVLFKSCGWAGWDLAAARTAVESV
jgi:ornithine cyclodeaminase